MAIFTAQNDQDIDRLLQLHTNNDNQMFNHYNTLSSLCDKNIYLKDVLKQYKLFFELKLKETIAQEKALLTLIHHLDNIIDTHDYNPQQSSHIEQQKDNIFRELLLVQNVIDNIRKIK